MMAGKRKIYTRSGDQGETSLIGGTRVLKSHDRVEAYGDIDELNSFLGLLQDHIPNTAHTDFLLQVQKNLVVIESLIAADPDKPIPEVPALDPGAVDMLEKEIDQLSAELPPLTSFILPGGDPAGSICHVARAVCRRAERATVRLHSFQPVDPLIIRYLNRLSDYLFILARNLGKDLRTDEMNLPEK